MVPPAKDLQLDDFSEDYTLKTAYSCLVIPHVIPAH
jgi:hypothetical protein